MKAAYQMVCNTSSPVHISEVDSEPSPLQQSSSQQHSADEEQQQDTSGSVADSSFIERERLCRSNFLEQSWSAGSLDNTTQNQTKYN